MAFWAHCLDAKVTNAHPAHKVKDHTHQPINQHTKIAISKIVATVSHVKYI